jgi:2-aminomuconate deaminase
MMQANRSDRWIVSNKAAEAVGPYPHARFYGGLIYLCGMGPRVKGEERIPGVFYDEKKQIITHDVAIQTHAVVQNLQYVLDDCGSSLANIIDIQVFLTNMKKDFKIFNKVYEEYFSIHNGPTRTTIEVTSLPTDICVEFKVVAHE